MSQSKDYTPIVGWTIQKCCQCARPCEKKRVLRKVEEEERLPDRNRENSRRKCIPKRGTSWGNLIETAWLLMNILMIWVSLALVRLAQGVSPISLFLNCTWEIADYQYIDRCIAVTVLNTLLNPNMALLQQLSSMNTPASGMLPSGQSNSGMSQGIGSFILFKCL